MIIVLYFKLHLREYGQNNGYAFSAFMDSCAIVDVLGPTEQMIDFQMNGFHLYSTLTIEQMCNCVQKCS